MTQFRTDVVTPRKPTIDIDGELVSVSQDTFDSLSRNPAQLDSFKNTWRRNLARPAHAQSTAPKTDAKPEPSPREKMLARNAELAKKAGQ